jgi:predicted Zn-dependent protease with MMP-like domain
MLKTQVKLDLLKAIAPIFVKEGNDLMNRLASNGNDPKACTIGDKPIMDEYASIAMEWVDVLYDTYIEGIRPKIYK